MRKRQPAKQNRPEPDPMLHRVASALANWRVIIGAVFALVAAGGVSYAFKDSLATKAELAPVLEHLSKHDVDLARFEQKLDDVAATVHEIREEQLVRRK